MKQLACILAASLLATHAGAQTTPDESAYVELKGGAGIEHAEDGASGGTGAAGLAGGIVLSRHWTGEVELWVPGFIAESPNAQHRDVLFSVSAVRTTPRDHTRPYWLIGLTLGRTESHVIACLASQEPGGDVPPTVVECSDPGAGARRRERSYNTSTYALVGGGVELRLSRRFRLTPEVRAHVSVGAVIVRGGVGLRWSF